MAVPPLLKDQIDGGLELARRLQAAGFPLVARFWAYNDESERWRLHLAMPSYDRYDPIAAYGFVRRELEGMNSSEIDLDDVVVATPRDRRVSAVLAVRARHQAPVPIRVTGATLEGVYFDGAYIYPPIPGQPATSPTDSAHQSPA